MAITPQISTQYLVSFYARASAAVNDLTVRYSSNGGTNFVACTDYNTQVIGTSGWTKITCLFTTDSTIATNPDLIITQATCTWWNAFNIYRCAFYHAQQQHFIKRPNWWWQRGWPNNLIHPRSLIRCTNCRQQR